MTDSQSLTSQVRTGLGWSAGSLATLIVLQLAYTSFTARSLTPHDFAYYACALALMSITQYLSLSTLGSAVLRHPVSDSQGLAGIALLLALAAGCLAALLLLVATPAWTALWNLPDATPTIHAAALYAFLAPVHGVAIALVRRRLLFARVAVYELASAVAGFAGGAIAVVVLKTGSALIWGQIIALSTGILIALRPAFVPVPGSSRRPSVTEMLRFSANVSGQNFATYLISNAPYLGISRLIGGSTLGLFTRVDLLVSLPVTHASQALGKLTYPLWGRIKDDETRRAAITDTIIATSLVSAVGFGILLGTADLIVTLLLGNTYEAAITPLRALAISGLIGLPLTVALAFQEASGHFQSIRRIQVTRLLSLSAILMAIWAPHLLVCIGAIILAQTTGHIVQLRDLARQAEIHLGAVLQAYLLHGSVFLTLGGIWLTANAIARDTGPTVLAGSIGTVAVLAVCAGLPANRSPGIAVIRARGIAIPNPLRVAFRHRR